MRKLIPISLILMFLTACNSKKEPQSKLQTQLNELDTVILNTKLSILEINRYRLFNRKKELFKIGKIGFNLSMDDLKVNSHASYKIDSGYIVFNKKTFVATCYIKTSRLVTPILDENKQLKIGTPGYLTNSTDKIQFEFKGNFFPHDQDPTATLFLTIGDSTGLVTESNSTIKTAYAKKNRTIKLIETNFYLNGFKWNLFEKENKSEIDKDSIVGNLKLIF